MVIPMNKHNTLGHQKVGFCEFYLLGCLRYGEKHILITVGVCCCLQICNSVVNMVVMGLVLGQSLMVISFLLLCKSIYLSFIMYCEVFCCLHVKYVVYKHVNKK